MNDEQLLERLRGALFRDPQAEPPLAVQVAMRRTLTARAITPRRRRVLVAAVVGASSLGVSSVAWAASGAPLPPAVRAAAYAIHIPVDSPAVADARDSRRALRDAIAGNDTVQIANSARRLRAELDKLDSGERSGLQPEADQLLRIADEHAQSGADPNESEGQNGQPGPTGQSDGRPGGAGEQPTGRDDGQSRTYGPAGASPDGASTTGDPNSQQGSTQVPGQPILDEQGGVNNSPDTSAKPAEGAT